MKKKSVLIFSLIFQLVFPKINFGQAPALGEATGFALFTSAGNIMNVGSTNIWGNVGTDIGTFSGDPLTLNVGNTFEADATTANAAIDVSAAYSYLNGLSCDSTINTPFGNGLVLVANRVYCLAEASTLNGDLILDAKGNSSAIFNFKIGGALTTAASSRIILKNGASFCNVYWQVGGAVNSNGNSIFRGTIIANGAINLLNTDTLEGRGLSIGGAINLSNNRVVGCAASGQSLPIKLLSFLVNPVGSNIEINWSTASEINNDYFTVEHSKDGVLFEEVLRTKGAGNSINLLQYSAIDDNPYNGTSYYRLKQTDYDGKLTYSPLVACHAEKSFKLNIYPNPFTTTFNISLNYESQNDECKLVIYSIFGEVISVTLLENKLPNFISSQFSTGVYFYKVIERNKLIQSGKLIAL